MKQVKETVSGGPAEGRFGSREAAGSRILRPNVQDGFVPKVTLFELKRVTSTDRGEKKAPTG